MININDKFTRGMLAGFIAWIPTLGLNWAALHFKFSTLMYLDFLSILVYGHKPANSLEKYFALFVTACFLSVLGAVFLYLLELLTPKNYPIKGMVFGGAVWFGSYTITSLYKVPELAIIPLKTAISNLVVGALYGLVLSFVVVKLNNKYEAAVQEKLIVNIKKVR